MRIFSPQRKYHKLKAIVHSSRSVRIIINSSFFSTTTTTTTKTNDSEENDEESSRLIRQKNATLRRLNDAMNRTQMYPQSQEIIRDFWKDRRNASRRKLWSIVDITRSIKARKGPLKVTAFHAIYSVAVTTPFMVNLYFFVLIRHCIVLIQFY